MKNILIPIKIAKFKKILFNIVFRIENKYMKIIIWNHNKIKKLYRKVQILKMKTDCNKLTISKFKLRNNIKNKKRVLMI
jgi:hypothetical protein